MNTTRPIRTDHIHAYLDRDINALPFLFKPYRGYTEEQIETLLQQLPENNKKVLINCVRNFIEHKFTTQQDVEEKEQKYAPIVETRNKDFSGTNPANKGTDLYWDGIFSADAKEENYTPFVWNVRKKWLNDINAAKKSGGCSACRTNAITRQHLGKLVSNAAAYVDKKQEPYITAVFKPTAGLGNVMFFIAAAYAHALRTGVNCKLPWNNDNTSKKLYNFLGEAAPLMNATGYNELAVYKENATKYEPIPFKLTSGAIEGYFQSEKHFSDYKQEIRNLFGRFIQPTKEGSLGIHIRLGDYRMYPRRYPLDYVSYLHKAAAKVSGFTSITVYSDEPDTALRLVRGIKEFKDVPVTLGPKDNIDALSHMTSMERLIISASTFSWWGAWLSSAKQIICHKRWILDGALDDTHMPCPGWTKI